MATFPEMKQYVERPKRILPQGETSILIESFTRNQMLMQPQFGWCARVFLDIAIVYALQKTIHNLNAVNPNLTQRIGLPVRKNHIQHINILKGGFADQIYKNPSQWRSGGLFSFTEVDINSGVKTVMTENNLWEKADGGKRLAPVFTEHKSGTITSKLSKMVEFLEEETPTTIGVTYSRLRVCLLQFYNSKKHTRHECIVCGTNKEKRLINPELTPTVDIYNPWGKIAEDVDPNSLYFTDQPIPLEARLSLEDIFASRKKEALNYVLETAKLFSFKWWK